MTFRTSFFKQKAIHALWLKPFVSYMHDKSRGFWLLMINFESQVIYLKPSMQG